MTAILHHTTFPVHTQSSCHPEIVCVMFGACFVAREVSGPDKKWGWKKENIKFRLGKGGRGGGGGKWNDEVVDSIPPVASRPRA